MRTYCLAVLLCLPLLSFGQSIPNVVADICPGGCSSNPSNLVERNGKVYFFATSPTAGRELHVYDGTSVSVAADIVTGPGSGAPPIFPSTSLTLLNGKLYFAANDTAGATRRYMYSYDGVNAPQKILVNGAPLPSIYGSSGVVNGNLFFAYNDSADRSQPALYDPASNSLQIFLSISSGYYAGKNGCPCDIRQIGPYVYEAHIPYTFGTLTAPYSPFVFDLNTGAPVYSSGGYQGLTFSQPGKAVIMGNRLFTSSSSLASQFPTIWQLNIPAVPSNATATRVDTIPHLINTANAGRIGAYDGSIWYSVDEGLRPRQPFD